jgi:O-antigen ligase
MDSKTFPVINFFGFGIRITEIIFFSLLFIILLNINSSSKDKLDFFIDRRLVAIYFFCFIVGIFILIAFIQGLFNRNPIILLDIRGILYTLVVVFFTSFIKKIEYLYNAYKFFIALLVISCFTNLLHLFVNIQTSIGKYSNVSVMLTLYLLCVSLSFFFTISNKRWTYFSLILLSFITCLFSLQKHALLGAVVSILATLSLSRGKISNAIKYKVAIWGAIIIFLLILILSQESIFYSIFGVSPDFYIASRILREDVGDISGGRFDMWSQILKDAISNPFYGKGLGVEGFTFDTIEIPVHEHNLIMWSLRRFSFVGTFFFLLIAILFFRYSFEIYKNELNNIKRALLLSSLTYGVVYFISNMVILLPFVFESAFIFWFCGAIVLIIAREQRKNNSKLNLLNV